MVDRCTIEILIGQLEVLIETTRILVIEMVTILYDSTCGRVAIPVATG